MIVALLASWKLSPLSTVGPAALSSWLGGRKRKPGGEDPSPPPPSTVAADAVLVPIELSAANGRLSSHPAVFGRPARSPEPLVRAAALTVVVPVEVGGVPGLSSADRCRTSSSDGVAVLVVDAVRRCGSRRRGGRGGGHGGRAPEQAPESQRQARAWAPASALPTTLLRGLVLRPGPPRGSSHDPTGQRLVRAGAEHGRDRVALGLGHPELRADLHSDLTVDVGAAVALPRRQPGDGVAVRLLHVERPVDGEEVERVVGEGGALACVPSLGTGLPAVRQRDVVDLDGVPVDVDPTGAEQVAVVAGLGRSSLGRDGRERGGPARIGGPGGTAAPGCRSASVLGAVVSVV